MTEKDGSEVVVSLDHIWCTKIILELCCRFVFHTKTWSALLKPGFWFYNLLVAAATQSFKSHTSLMSDHCSIKVQLTAFFNSISFNLANQIKLSNADNMSKMSLPHWHSQWKPTFEIISQLSSDMFCKPWNITEKCLLHINKRKKMANRYNNTS